MFLRDAIAPGQAESSVNSGIISTNPIDKAAQFLHVSLFRSLEPSISCLCLAFFEQSHTFLPQWVSSFGLRIDKRPGKDGFFWRRSGRCDFTICATSLRTLE